MRLRDRAVIITGAGGGIGRAVARAFAAEGAAVVASDLNASAGETATLLQRDGARAIAIEADVVDMAAMDGLVG